MRLNRGTISLLAILLVVIIAVLVINNQQASAPGETPTPSTVTGALLPGVVAENIVRFEVRDNNTGDFTALTKDSGGAWNIDSTNALPDRNPEQALIDTTAGQIVAINYTNTFQAADLPNFGLDSPDYTVFVTTSDGQFYTIYVGAKQPTGPRYYTVVEQSSVPAATDTPDDGGGAVATSEIDGENENEGGILPTEEATTEATTDAASKPVRQEATAEATDESGSVATPEVDGVDEATSEATIDLTLEPTAETTAESTAEMIENPRVTLEGEQTVYLIPQTVIDTLRRWLTTPPYAPLPTAAPELEGAEGTLQPTPLLEEGADPALIPEGTPAATQESTAEATAAS